MELSEIVAWRKGLDYSRDVPAIDILQNCFDSLFNMIVEERAKVIRVTQRHQGLPESRVLTVVESKKVALHELGLEGV